MAALAATQQREIARLPLNDLIAEVGKQCVR
jgi:hypothetical protein